MAWNIVRHAFVIVFGNLKEALKVSVAPFIMLVCIIAVSAFLLGLPIGGEQTTLANANFTGSLALLFIIIAVAVMFTFGWIAVTWHRYILLEEYPGVVPSISDRPIGTYIARMLMIVLQMSCVMIPLMFLVLPLIMGGGGRTIAGFVGVVGLNVMLTFIWLRLSVSLPSVAVGEPMGSVEAWTKTNDVWEMILGISIIVIVLNFAATTIVTTLFSGIPVVFGVLSIAVQWVSMMVGISILTTIYGHVIEGRSLTGT